MRKRFKKIVNLNFLIFAIAIYCLPNQVFAAKQDIKIGVLAYRGIEQCYNEWNSTADYLTSAIPEHVFKIIPLPFNKVNTTVTNREIDFIIANSSIYVELEQKYFCSRIATLVNKGPGKGCTVFGGVIFFRADRHDIKTLANLRGKKFVATDEISLGGWRAAWAELKKAGINPYKDFTELKFAGTHDGAVFAVKDKVADAGTVRTDTLERMSAEGKISLQDFQIIPFHGIGPEYDNFPFRLSTRLYPEWPIAKLRHTSDELARKVAAALLTLPSDSPAARSAKVEGWTIPYNYELVDELLKFLRVGPYEHFGKVTLKDVVREYWHLILSFGALLFSLVLGLFYVAKLNANLKISRLRLQEELKERTRTEEEVRRLSRHNQLILNAAGEGIVGLDLQGKVTFVNPVAAHLTGYITEELLGNDLHEIIHHTKPDGTPYPICECPMHISLIEGRPSRVRDEVLWKKDGTSFVVAYSSSPIVEEEAIVGAVVVFRDITKRKQAEVERVRLEAQLHQAQKMEAIGRLAGGIAHDFNNILWAITGFAELTLQSVPRDSQEHYNLSQLLKAGERAKDLVKQIMAFSRRTSQEKIPLQISSIIKETLKLLRASLPTTIDIKENLAAPEALVLADPTQIHQILLNLGANAAHAMRENGGLLEVNLEEVSLDSGDLVQHPDLTPGPYVKLTVRDTGQGVDQEIISRIFEPFFTTKEVGEGTGMGLAVVHGIVKSSGGEITIYSQPGEGTIFTILLPKITGKVATASAATPPLPTGNNSILFIDDEAMLADMTKEMLKKLGYQVVAQISSLEALKIFQDQPEKFDLVITDQTMPHMTGMQLAQELRHLRPDIPIILCTGYSEKVSSENIKAAGIDELLMKPIVLRNLAETIRKVLD